MDSRKSKNSQTGSTILLSVKPRFSKLIVGGKKRVEIRRTWPSVPVSFVLIYESAPTKRIVAIAHVSKVESKAPRPLWEHAKSLGTGLSRAEFLKYLAGKKMGFAATLEKVNVFERPAAPARIFKSFTAPQSFRYLTQLEIEKAWKLFHTMRM